MLSSRRDALMTTQVGSIVMSCFRELILPISHDLANGPNNQSMLRNLLAKMKIPRMNRMDPSRLWGSNRLKTLTY
jgi:hypothetical protein